MGFLRGPSFQKCSRTLLQIHTWTGLASEKRWSCTTCNASVLLAVAEPVPAHSEYSKPFSAVQPRVSFLWLWEQSVWIVYAGDELSRIYPCMYLHKSWNGWAPRWDLPITRLPNDERILLQLLRLIHCSTRQLWSLTKVIFSFCNWSSLV